MQIKMTYQNKKENYLLCIGRLEKIKGFHHAIKAFAGIVQKVSIFTIKSCW